MGERAGVEDDPGEAFLLGPLQPVDQLPLVVRLATVDPYASPPPVLMDQAIDVLKGGVPVDALLPRSEKIQVGPVQHESGRRQGWGSAAGAMNNMSGDRRRKV